MTPTTGKISQPVKPAPPGRITISMPTSPTPIAAQRRQPTGSRRNSAAPSVTTSGAVCMIAAISESGIFDSPTIIPSAPIISKTLRSITFGAKASVSRSGTRRHSAIVTRSALQPRLSITMTCPTGAVWEASFRKASLAASNAIEATISAMARSVSTADQVITSGASRPVRLLISAMVSAAAMTSASASCGSRPKAAGSVSTFSR